MGKEKEEEFNFNDSKSFEKLAKEISKEKLKNSGGLKSIPGKIIGFVTSHVAVTAIVAFYFIACGLASNIIWIYKLIRLIF